MADGLKPAEGELPEMRAAEQPVTAKPGAAHVETLSQHPAQSSRALWALIIALLLICAFLSWRAYFFEEEGDPVASAMFAFEKQNSLVVFASRFEVVAESEYEQTVVGVPVRTVRQAMIVPATVDYRLDLSGLDTDDFAWDAEAQTLSVTIPALRTSTPNIDEANARLFTEGLLNTGGSQQMLSEKNSEIAAQKASAFAKNPQVLSLARAAAKDAVRQNLAVAMQVAGLERARVEVVFEGEN
ncbi:MAG: DUF4230 domain-containing protein [Pseudomonadota bacterium]